MQAYELSKLISKKESRDKLNLEFLKVPDLSMGLPKGPLRGRSCSQVPHTEGEVYYVVSGRAQIKVADEDRAVQGRLDCVCGKDRYRP